MGAWNYYIEIKADKLILNDMLAEYKQNKTFQKAFYFGKCEDAACNGYNAGIASVIDNFLPANHLIYQFLSHYRFHNLHIKTNTFERPYDFVNKADFIKFMYDSWENKIDAVYEIFGVMIIGYEKYQTTRRKLYNKHYIYISETTKG